MIPWVWLNGSRSGTSGRSDRPTAHLHWIRVCAPSPCRSSISNISVIFRFMSDATGRWPMSGRTWLRISFS